MEINFYNIFKTFFKTGTLLLGGGYVILPLLQSELAEKKQWLCEDELYEFYALSQSVPGIIAANMSIFTGYKLLGFKGALAAATGITTPAFLAIIIIAGIMEKIINLGFVHNIFMGVGIGVLVLIYLAVREMWSKSVTDKYTCIIFFTAFFLSAFLRVPPSVIIITAIITGLIAALIGQKTLKGGKTE